ncbi:MAG: zf-HC2 domain-containing protein [Gemmatimonadetes bacterium]|nr:zf-HC2 domain-containing protein [Gemmatimonadota bacterium]
MSHVDDGQLNALLDGELEPADARAIETHLASCALCTKRLEEAKQFLAEASSLLDVLVPPERSAARSEAAPAAGAAPAASVPTPIPGPERRVSKTAKEVAVDIDGSTQKSPAIRPIFPREALRRAADEGAKAGPPGRRVDWSQLAWAATVVLAVSVGYMVNELQHARRLESDLAEAPAEEGAARAPAARDSLAAGPAATRATERERSPAPVVPRSVATKPPTARGTKPRPAAAAEDAIPLRPGAAVPGRELAAQDRANLAGGAGVGAAPSTPPTARQQTPSVAIGALPVTPSPARPSPRQAPPPAFPAPSAGAPAAPTAAPAGPDRTARHLTRTTPADSSRAVPLTTFRRISLDQAARRLSGAIRLIDGRPWDHVEVGPGRLVPGADRTLDVVRVYYFDDGGRPLILDQQRIPAPAPTDTSADTALAAVEGLGLAPGDTLVTTTPNGGVRIRWLDRKYFWLSLSGTMSADSLRMLVNRVR